MSKGLKIVIINEETGEVRLTRNVTSFVAAYGKGKDSRSISFLDCTGAQAAKTIVAVQEQIAKLFRKHAGMEETVDAINLAKSIYKDGVR